MNAMVISPHPDDETLGAGGTLLKLKDQGHRIYWLNVTNIKAEYGYEQKIVDDRNDEIETVKKAYSFDGFWNLGLEPAGIDKYEMGQLISSFKTILEEIKPEILLIPYCHDVHSDHRVIFDAIYSCTKSFRAPFINTVLSMEILSETDQAQQERGFVPNVFINIDGYVERKAEIMSIYKSEVDMPPFPRNIDAIKGLAAFRGATGYYKNAEAFCLVKSRIN